MEQQTTKEIDLQGRLIAIQNELKVPKGNYNSFGKYKYRSAEDILEAVKPLCNKYKCMLFITDTIISINDKLFMQSTAKMYYKHENITVTGLAQLGEHKGMSTEQCTGTASSYARKYALNGLFLIDETEADPDHPGYNKKPEPVKESKPLQALPESKADSVVDFLQKGGTIEQVQKK